MYLYAHVHALCYCILWKQCDSDLLYVSFWHLFRHLHLKDRNKQDVSNHQNTEQKWNQRHDKGQSLHHPTSSLIGTGGSNSLPTLAKPAGSLLSIWTNKKQAAANSSHDEFAGRIYGDAKTELYKKMRISKWVVNNCSCVRLYQAGNCSDEKSNSFCIVRTLSLAYVIEVLFIVIVLTILSCVYWALSVLVQSPWITSSSYNLLYRIIEDITK